MKIILFYCLVFSSLTTAAFAHPPSNIQMQYDQAKNELVVSVNHRIAANRHEKDRTHFIKEIDLEINGKTIDSKTFVYQNSSIVKARFAMPKHENNDQLTVKAICSTDSELSSQSSISSLLKYKQND
ncbi:MAG: hypothetical protein KKD05_08595 [Candidatus Omnitrophica bacterium]|nr:hypothetical protein [Candidatus Omnitrophota bacterium]